MYGSTLSPFWTQIKCIHGGIIYRFTLIIVIKGLRLFCQYLHKLNQLDLFIKYFCRTIEAIVLYLYVGIMMYGFVDNLISSDYVHFNFELKYSSCIMNIYCTLFPLHRHFFYVIYGPLEINFLSFSIKQS